MSLSFLWALVVLSVTRPAEAADRLLSLRLPRGVLWAGLLLASALNAILFSLSDLLLPTPPMFPSFLHSPLVYFGLVVLGLVAFIQALTWSGRVLGGEGGPDDVMAVIVWLQFLRILVQAASLLLVLTVPVLSLVLVMAATFVGLYIMLNFIARAHRLDSLGKAAFVLVLAALAVIVAASVLIALAGGPILGSIHHV